MWFIVLDDFPLALVEPMPDEEQGISGGDPELILEALREMGIAARIVHEKPTPPPTAP